MADISNMVENIPTMNNVLFSVFTQDEINAGYYFDREVTDEQFLALTSCILLPFMAYKIIPSGTFSIGDFIKKDEKPPALFFVINWALSLLPVGEIENIYEFSEIELSKDLGLSIRSPVELIGLIHWLIIYTRMAIDNTGNDRDTEIRLLLVHNGVRWISPYHCFRRQIIERTTELKQKNEEREKNNQPLESEVIFHDDDDNRLMEMMAQVGESCAHAIENNPEIAAELVDTAIAYTPPNLLGEKLQGTGLEFYFRERIGAQLDIVKNRLWELYSESDNPSHLVALLQLSWHSGVHYESLLYYEMNRVISQFIATKEEFVSGISVTLNQRLEEFRKCIMVAKRLEESSKYVSAFSDAIKSFTDLLEGTDGES